MTDLNDTYVLYHNNCPDGFGAAFAAWKKFGSNAHYIAVDHGNPPPKMKTGSQVYIVDFAYSRQILDQLSKEHPIQIIDHHKSAQEELSHLPNAIFDMTKSGAVLTWEYFHPGTDIPLLLQYIQDKDLWQFLLPQSDEFTVALSLYDFDFEIWEQLSVPDLLAEGELLLRYKRKLLHRLCREFYWQIIAGYRVPVANSPLFASEIGNRLCQEHPDAPFAACYVDYGSSAQGWSLRSIGEFDVSAVAKQFGGGGHRNAAGFSIHPARPPLDSISE